MKEISLLQLIATLRLLDGETFILLGQHLSRLGRLQIATILERNISEFSSPDYPDNFDCIFEASEAYRKSNGSYPECEEERTSSQNKNS